MQPDEAPQTFPRINRAIAESGFCSRRKADEYIQSGKVRLNGNIVTNPAVRVQPDDKLEVDGKLLSRQPHIYLMLHKPTQCVCTVRDPEGRQTVMDFVPEKYKNLRLFPVGRLDYFSEGLLLITNDGNFANILMHPTHHVPKFYEVIIRGTVDRKKLDIMRHGMILKDGVRLLPVKIKADVLDNGNTRLSMELRQGINRQIRTMCQQLNLVILRLKRVAQGSLKLGSLAKGKTRELEPSEIRELTRL